MSKGMTKLCVATYAFESEPGVMMAQRACRRHGIQRWPRRQLLKLSRAIDQINATANPAEDVQEGIAQEGSRPGVPVLMHQAAMTARACLLLQYGPGQS